MEVSKILIDKVEALLSEMHKQQVEKAKKVAHKIIPSLTDEDLLNPDNFAQIAQSPQFMYEDGIAAGILSSKIALRALLNNG